jgi:hypothetical protein
MTTTDEYGAALERVRAYAEKIRDGEKVVDQESLDRAADLARLYEDKRWIAEEAAAGRAPKTKVHNGRPVDPAARHRFGTWLLHGGGLSPRQTTALLKAHDWETTYSRGPQKTRLVGETSIRPLYALGRKGYGDETPKVLARAQEIAGDGMPITSAHTKQAVREFWASIPKPQQRKQAKTVKADQLRQRALTIIDELIEMGAYGSAQQALREGLAHLKSRRQLKAVV